MIATIALQQLVSLRRRRLLHAVVGVIAACTALAGLLGWASHRTILGVYDEATRLLETRGQAPPPNPFLATPALSMLSNMVIYVTMIGALVALIVGHVVIAEDETGGLGRLVFSRPVSRRSYTLGKLAAVAIVLGAAMAVSTLISITALTLVNRTLPAGTDIVRLLGFYGLSWLYLMMFAAVGAATLLLTRRRSFGLLTALGVWLIVTFVLPQFTSGLRPTQSLNPIVDPVSTSQRFFRVTAAARPLSIAEQFKTAAARILATSSERGAGNMAAPIVPVAAAFVLFTFTMAVLIARHDYSRSDADA